jgi:hypothetical protein
MLMSVDPSPGGPADREERVQRIVDFWNAQSVDGNSGETTLGVLDEIQAKVTDYLSCGLIARAESLTALAGLLMAGQRDS